MWAMGEDSLPKRARKICSSSRAKRRILQLHCLIALSNFQMLRIKRSTAAYDLLLGRTSEIVRYIATDGFSDSRSLRCGSYSRIRCRVRTFSKLLTVCRSLDWSIVHILPRAHSDLCWCVSPSRSWACTRSRQSLWANCGKVGADVGEAIVYRNDAKKGGCRKAKETRFVTQCS